MIARAPYDNTEPGCGRCAVAEPCPVCSGCGSVCLAIGFLHGPGEYCGHCEVCDACDGEGEVASADETRARMRRRNEVQPLTEVQLAEDVPW